MNAFKTPQEKTIENIPGVVPENPYRYMLDLITHDRRIASKQTGHSPAATSFMMSSAGEYQGVRHNVQAFTQNCIDIQRGKNQPSSLGMLMGEKAKEQMQEMRMHHMEYALMRRDFAQEKLAEAQKFKWGYLIPIRAAILLELEGLLPTFEEVREQCILDDSPESEQYSRTAADYFYRIIFAHVLEKYTGIDADDAAQSKNLQTCISTDRRRLYDEFLENMYGRATKIFHKAKQTGSIDPEEAKILAMHISWGETGNLYKIDDHTLSRHIVGRGETVKKEEIKQWFPKKVADKAA